MRISYWLLFFLSIYFFFSFSAPETIPPIWPDEVLFFNPSYELYKNGILRTSVESGLIPGMDRYTLWMPPLYMILQSGVFLLFSDSIYIARGFTSIIGGFSLILLYLFLKNLQWPERQIRWATALLATDFLFIRISHSARMESLCLFLFLVSLFFLTLHRKNQQSLKNWQIFFSGSFLSLSFLAHPFAAVFGLVILYLLWEWRLLDKRTLVHYFLSGIWPISLWLFLYVVPHWDIFLIQFGSQFARKNELLGVFSQWTKVKVILSSFPLPIFKTILFLITIPPAFYYFSVRKDRKFRIVVIWPAIILVFLYFSSESWYVYHLSLPLAIFYAFYWQSQQKWIRYLPWAMFIFQFFSLFWVYGTHFYYDISQKNQQFYHEISQELVNSKNIYIQSIPDPYFYLRKHYPDKKLLEFLPGELPVKSSHFRETIQKQDAFIFYNEKLINPVLNKYLQAHKKQFLRKEIYIATPKSQTRLYAVLYLKRI